MSAFIFWVLDLYFECLDLYFGFWTYILGFELIFECLDLYFECLNLYFGCPGPVGSGRSAGLILALEQPGLILALELFPSRFDVQQQTALQSY